MKPASGKFVIRMPGALHGRLREEARRTGQSLNQLCVARLQAGEPSAAAVGRTIVAGTLAAEFLARILRRWRGDLVGVVLFGSTARGDATEDSDLDLLLVMKPEIGITRDLYRQWEEFCLECPQAQVGGVSPHFVSLPGSVRQAGGLWYETAIDGVILWEQNRLVSRFLGSVREAMGHGRIQRRILHGSPYWVKHF